VPEFFRQFFYYKEENSEDLGETLPDKTRVIHIYKQMGKLAAFWVLLEQQNFFN
jgi:hypothetical protein